MRNILVLLLISAHLLAQKYQTQTYTDAAGYTYSIVTNDPLQARLYTLKNGLSVYLTVYKDKPRIQTYIAVRAGSKNDPSSLTGLAHYLEHMVFKGTSKIGAYDWTSEKKLIDQIENLYETYRYTSDTILRKNIYKKIDSVSGIAANYAIANEYDKMLNTIGAKGTNAYTWVEQTVYVNDIPANELERWIKIESERFRELTPRLFHTELEAVYEEKNRSLDNDMSKVFEATFNLMFPNHPYGSQTTIGTVEHLKNPSIKAIKEYFNTYYVPNNMAICLSGDLHPEETIKLIDAYWGQKPSKPIPPFVPYVEKPIENVISKTVIGPSPQSIMLCFRFPGATSKDAMIMEMFARVLSNGKAGLMDLNLTQKQKVLQVSGFPYRMKDYSVHLIFAMPREGQSLDEVKNLILAQIDSVKAGKFDEELLKAIINNEKISMMKSLENNGSRADYFVDAFIKGIPWANYIATLDEMAKMTKKDIVEFANTYYHNNYAVVYKLTGKDSTIKKVPKPPITPVNVNREKQSAFLTSILSHPTQPVSPAFVDFEKDMNRESLPNGNPVFYVLNKENTLFELTYRYKIGKSTMPKLALAINYLNYLGTRTMTPEQIKQKLFALGCEFEASVQDDQMYISLSGLSENMPQAMSIVEELLADPKPNAQALADLVEGTIKERADAKLDKNTILRSAMVNYAQYGSYNPFTKIIPENELRKTKPQELVSLIKSIYAYTHEVWYYGPLPLSELKNQLVKSHKMSKKSLPAPKKWVYKEQNFDKNEILFLPYDMVQAEIIFLTKAGKFERALLPAIKVYNEYFGGSMNSIVFQEIRESKALAYAASSRFRSTSDKDYSNYNASYIGTQADKMPDAIAAMLQLLDSLPKSEVLFQSSKEAVLNSLRTERVTKSAIIDLFDSYQKLGLQTDIRKEIFEEIPNISFDKIKHFHAQHIKNKKMKILIIGSKDRLNLKALEKYGTIKELTLKEVFGY